MLKTSHLFLEDLALVGSCQGAGGQQQGGLRGAASLQRTSLHCQVGLCTLKAVCTLNARAHDNADPSSDFNPQMQP